MDEMPSLSRNDCNGRVNVEKVKKKKKKKRSKTTEQHELTESPQEQTEKRRKKKDKRRNSQTESDDNLQTHTGKKKRRKLDNEGETTVMDDGVSNQHEAQTQELQGSSEEKTSKRKKKSKKRKHTNCEDMAKQQQTDISTEHEEEPNRSDEESELPDVMITAKKRERKTQIDSEILEELKELFPKISVESRTKCFIKNIIRNELPRFRDFKKQGIEMRNGRFSTAENERVRQNVSDFMTLIGVEDAVKIFFPNRFPKETKTLKRLKKKNRCLERIADGIPRLCADVYERASKVFDDRNYKGQFSKEEKKSLIKYFKRYGKDWQKISDKTNRCCTSLERQFVLLNKRKGPWTTKEIQRLLRAVRDYVVSVLKSENPNKRTPKRVSREILHKNLPWRRIAKQVKTRCWITCRAKWIGILTARMSSWTSFRGRKALKAKIKLIKAMYEMQVEDVVDVHWEDLTAIFGDVPLSYVRIRWHNLKVYYVPDWKNKCFGDIVDFLYENVLPGLVKECEDLDDDDDDDDDDGDDDDDELKVDQMSSFRLADIFQDINEDECCDTDEETGQQE